MKLLVVFVLLVSNLLFANWVMAADVKILPTPPDPGKGECVPVPGIPCGEDRSGTLQSMFVNVGVVMFKSFLAGLIASVLLILLFGKFIITRDRIVETPHNLVIVYGTKKIIFLLPPWQIIIAAIILGTMIGGWAIYSGFDGFKSGEKFGEFGDDVRRRVDIIMGN